MTTIPRLDPSPVSTPSIEDAPNLYEDGVLYPETDGQPLPDGETQGPVFQELVPTLRSRYANRPRTRVNGNTFIYYERGNPRRSISPDCYVAFDVDVDTIEYHNTYRVWAVGKPPDFVLEIASKNTADRDLGEKRELYAQIGINEYWRYDPTPNSLFYGEPLVGEVLIDGRYRRLPVATDGEGRTRGYSPKLGLDLVRESDGRLRFYDPVTGEWLRNFDETRAELADEQTTRAAAETRLADEQTARVAAETRLADEQTARVAAEARAAELEAELRRLRGESA